MGWLGGWQQLVLGICSGSGLVWFRRLGTRMGWQQLLRPGLCERQLRLWRGEAHSCVWVGRVEHVLAGRVHSWYASKGESLGGRVCVLHAKTMVAWGCAAGKDGQGPACEGAEGLDLHRVMAVMLWHRVMMMTMLTGRVAASFLQLNQGASAVLKRQRTRA